MKRVCGKTLRATLLVLALLSLLSVCPWYSDTGHGSTAAEARTENVSGDRQGSPVGGAASQHDGIGGAAQQAGNDFHIEYSELYPHLDDTSEPVAMSFAVIADVHLGVYSADYGSLGWEHDLKPDVGSPTRVEAAERLEAAVQWINSQDGGDGEDDIRFVVVLGDITDRAEDSQFDEAYGGQEAGILEGLTVPWIPLIGNHDMRPYVYSWDKRISSLLVPPGAAVTLFDGADYTGDNIWFGAPGVRNLADYGWDNRASSLLVTGLGVVKLWDGVFEGDTVYADSGLYGDLNQRQASVKDGDNYCAWRFDERFGPQYIALGNALDGWIKQSPQETQYLGEYFYFQNFAFNYGGYYFICLDFNSRTGASPGTMGDGEIYNWPGYTAGTTQWLEARLDQAPLAEDNTLILAHIPFRNYDLAGWSCFNIWEMNDLQAVLEPHKQQIGGWFGGHLEWNEVVWSDNLLFNVIQTSHLFTKDGVPGTIRVVRLHARPWDVNRDECVDILDVLRIGQRIGQTGLPYWIPEDVNSDGVISVLDVIVVGQHYGEGC